MREVRKQVADFGEWLNELATDPALLREAGDDSGTGSVLDLNLLGPITNGVVMRRHIAVITATIAMAVIPLTVLQVTTAGASRLTQPKTPGAITMQAWLRAIPSTNGLSATVYECAEITGAIVDQGGDPTWNDSNYATMSSPASKCGNYEPVGGYVMVPPPSGANNTLTTFYAVHTLTLQKGQIFITYAGTYNLTGTESDGVPPYQTGPDTTWVITGGMGSPHHRSSVSLMISSRYWKRPGSPGSTMKLESQATSWPRRSNWQ